MIFLKEFKPPFSKELCRSLCLVLSCIVQTAFPEILRRSFSNVGCFNMGMLGCGITLLLCGISMLPLIKMLCPKKLYYIVVIIIDIVCNIWQQVLYHNVVLKYGGGI